MKVFLTGGTGFLGSSLTQKLLNSGHAVSILTRSAKNRKSQPGTTFVEGNPLEKGPWQKEVGQHDCIINLAGASIFCRWNEANKKAIYDSRILTTRHLVEAIPSQPGSRMILLNGSAVGYYGFRNGEELNESGTAGNDFLASVVKEWETEALLAEQKNTRVVYAASGSFLAGTEAL